MGRFLLVLVGACGCIGPLFGDGTSISIGTSSSGALLHGIALPPEGDGYVVPPNWRKRGSLYGTEELVDALVRAARVVAREQPGGLVGIADLSPRGGGRTVKHRSHENGRDVDVIYFAVDDAGRPLRPADAMVKYDYDGVSHGVDPDVGRPAAGWEPTHRRFDTGRNWAMVRALLEDPEVEVQWIFVAPHLRARLLEYAQQIGEPVELVERAAWVLHRPNDSQAHDDHMHVRVLCDPGDRDYGCVDKGPVRWWKKRYKYMEPGSMRVSRLPVPPGVAQLAVSPTWLLAR